MKRLALALTLAAVFAGPAAAADLVMPTLTVTNPTAGIVDLAWAHLPPSSYVILWQCDPVHGCLDTIRPNTGNTEIDNVSAGEHGYQVCVPANPQDVCTPTVWMATQ
ncbi:MAG TPA: hypothetical protein VKQ71_12075 [Acidimicrobiales bacterium]|nr:hypothetical protein [Acidimicrobiales bacterium]